MVRNDRSATKGSLALSREAAEPIRKISIIVSKGTLDMAYPGLILANAARMSGIDASLFFMLWGLDVITAKTVDKLHVPTVGNPAMHIPTFVGGLPGFESLATAKMRKQMEELDIPPVPEMLSTLGESGAKLFACELSMDMFKRTPEDLVDEVTDVISVGDFYDESAGAQMLFI